MNARPRAALPRGAWRVVASGLAILAVVGVVSAAFVIQSNSGSAGGEQNGSAFLAHWQQTAVMSTATPLGALAAVSTTAAAPTQLPAASGAYRVDATTARDLAVEWVFTESTGIGTSLEIEVEYSVQYTVGVVANTGSGTVYFESQAAAPGVAYTFDVYWDAGAATGVTFVSESEISQTCSAVGTCP